MYSLNIIGLHNIISAYNYLWSDKYKNILFFKYGHVYMMCLFMFISVYSLVVTHNDFQLLVSL